MWTGLILAGGASVRMGRDKASRLLQGRTLLSRAVDRVLEAGGAPLVVAPASVASLVPGYRWLDEADGAGGASRAGPLPALRRGLEVCGTRKAVALACDLPFVPAALLRYMIEELDRFDAVVPKAADRFQVLAAAYTVACLGAIDRELGEGRRAMHRFLDRVRLKVLDAEDLAPFGGGDIFYNVNRPEDLAVAEARLAGGGS